MEWLDLDTAPKDGSDVLLLLSLDATTEPSPGLTAMPPLPEENARQELEFEDGAFYWVKVRWAAGSLERLPARWRRPGFWGEGYGLEIVGFTGCWVAGSDHNPSAWEPVEIGSRIDGPG